MNDDNVYNSGLNDADWLALRDVIWPFIHADDPSKVDIPEVPMHLKNHPMLKEIKKYKGTGNDKYLDKAGQYLIPTGKSFGWYVPLTK